jgi:predicted NBD/HSP70 family sugar kinase
VPPARLYAVGVCVPGFADGQLGICHAAPNLDWHEVPVGPVLAEALDAPVHLRNDAQAALVAEHAEGAATGCRDVVLLYAGTGISAPAMLDGRISQGRTGAIGQVGHCPVPGGDRLCNCGRTGCLETVASGPAIVRAYVEALRGAGSRRDLSRVVASDVAHAAARGDATARRVLDGAGNHLGAAAATVVSLFDPEIVVFGGGLSAAGDALVEPLRRAVRASGGGRVRFAVSVLGDRAEARGAVLVALEQMGLSSVRQVAG